MKKAYNGIIAFKFDRDKDNVPISEKCKIRLTGDRMELPIINFDLPDPEPLSMDEYAAFCLLCLKSNFDRKEHERQKKEHCVTVPFRIVNDEKSSSR